MSVAITVRNVPEEVRARLAEKAARSGKSLQEFLSAELTDLAFRQSPVDFIAGLAQRVELEGLQVDARQIVEARDADRT
jgi:plasmid stability protein